MSLSLTPQAWKNFSKWSNWICFTNQTCQKDVRLSKAKGVEITLNPKHNRKLKDIRITPACQKGCLIKALQCLRKKFHKFNRLLYSLKKLLLSMKEFTDLILEVWLLRFKFKIGTSLLLLGRNCWSNQYLKMRIHWSKSLLRKN